MAKKKKNIKRKKVVTLVLSILVSCAFPLGILGTIFGAIGDKMVVMALGLVGLVGSFFALPFVWLAFGGLVTKAKVCDCVVNRKITDVKTLAQIFGKNEQEMTNILNNLIAKGYIDYTTLYNQIEKPHLLTKNKCPNCGAGLVKKESGLYCEYCESIFHD